MLVSMGCCAGDWQSTVIADMPTQIYLPSTPAKVASGRALMVSLGGCGQQDADDTEFRDQSNWPATADEYGMVVAIPNAPDEGVTWAGCWDYYKSDHSRSTRHDDNLLQLVAELIGRAQLNIDPNQVYISGLSSGGGMVNVLLCLAPELFAGGGIAAGPALGSSMWQTRKVAVSVEQVVAGCRTLAGSQAEALQTQIAAIVWGDQDSLAAPGYAEVSAAAYAQLYGATKNAAVTAVPGVKLNGLQESWSDSRGPRVLAITIAGLGHAWPAGGGSGASKYMDNSSINFPRVLTDFLFANNRRVQKP
ncbi:PHB depolymerase family esterase [Halioxenophilus sp. WMMB6]|uniref:extracellular catalytic domain type 1 short-chain-length polyhydroxyalkanoate depolymerase n=1 Tax=Halioxenophilus sp. WMMB6 TaxID=3073815 RepID=UPI00295EA93C|nr:PHB depolymerase family esterase [Halioxenophilus sp. WMMB6]